MYTPEATDLGRREVMVTRKKDCTFFLKLVLLASFNCRLKSLGLGWFFIW